MAIQDSFSHIIYAFYSHYNTVWIANTEIGLDPNDSVKKRLWCIRKYSADYCNNLKLCSFQNMTVLFLLFFFLLIF